MAGSALAQSTAGQVQELIVTGARHAPSTAGLATQVNEAKDQSIVGAEFIATQSPSANFAQLISLLPGVTYSSEDPGGFNSGDLRIHGFDGNHVAVVLDGAPLNDTGNYAVYPGEYIIGELIDHMTVNIGSSDVDSPSASALGATVNVVTKTPSDTMGGMVHLSAGDYNYKRLFGEIDTGAVGPWGTKAFLAGEYGREDNYKSRPGYSMRWGIHGRVYQPLNGSDFLSLSGNFTRERQYPAFRLSPAAFAINPYDLGDTYTWIPAIPHAGVADAVPAGDANYYKLFPNPVDFATLRGQSRFSLTKDLTLTVDPSLYYTIANGGGGIALKETDQRLIGGSKTIAGIDLNGDGDTLDTVEEYSPQTTTTHRLGLTSSLLYELNEQNHFQLAYTLDYGRHRQTGEVTTIDQLTGVPANVFGGREGYGPTIATADGSILRNRDRFSIAILNQVSANYIGKFMDDKLHVNLGVRLPYFQRKLNQLCYTYNGTSAYCDTVDPTVAQITTANPRATAAITPTVNAAGVRNFRTPFSETLKYHKALPNLGATYRIAEDHLVYVSYAKGLAAPKTDNLYTSSTDKVKPELSDNFAAGYRYQTRMLTLSVNGYDTEYRNRIVSSPDPTDSTLTIDRNIGDVRIRGVDIEAGYKPIDHLNIYASANFNDSKVKKSYPLTTAGIVFQLPVQGKELVATPDRIFNGRVSYDFGSLTVGAQAKYNSYRWADDINTVRIPGYAVFGLDARYKLPVAIDSYIQVNVQNLFDRLYLSRSTTAANYTAYAIPNTTPARTYTPSAISYYVGAPRTVTITLGAKF